MSLLSFSKKILNRKEDAKKKSSSAKKAAKPQKTSTKKKKKKEQVSILAGRIDMQLLMTEQSLGQAEHNTLVFRVRPSATKGQVAKAVAEKYGAQVLGVRTASFKPKTRRRGQTMGRTKTWKKAYVHVHDVESILASS